MLITVNNRLILEIEIVHDLSCHPVCLYFIHVLLKMVKTGVDLPKLLQKQRQLSIFGPPCMSHTVKPLILAPRAIKLFWRH